MIDSISMKLVTAPQQFDVVVTTNQFGDILTDIGAGLVGGLGSAPDIAKHLTRDLDGDASTTEMGRRHRRRRARIAAISCAGPTGVSREDEYAYSSRQAPRRRSRWPAPCLRWFRRRLRRNLGRSARSR